MAAVRKEAAASDEVAVEATDATRLFYEAVAPHVARIVAVETNQFRVISQSVQKTDERDAALPAPYLSTGLPPEVRMKNQHHGRVASLTQTRERTGGGLHVR